MAAPRDWNKLSPTYQARLKRAGITRSAYLSGVNLQKARGQKIEARRTVERKIAGLPAQSTVRRRTKAIKEHPIAWAGVIKELKKRNLEIGGMTNNQWQAGLKKHGIQTTINIAEQRLSANYLWNEGLSTYEIDIDAADWPDVWGHYH